MPMFQKKRPVVEAEQFKGDADSAERVAALAGDAKATLHADGLGRTLALHAGFNFEVMHEGDWLVKTRKGRLRVLSDEAFQERYAEIRGA